MMRRRVLPGLILVAISALGLFLPPGREIFVDDDAGFLQIGTENFPYGGIQQAIDAAREGSTIRIAVGYYRPFILNRRLILKGAGIDNARVVSEDGAPSILSRTDGAVVEGLSFIGPGNESAPAGRGVVVENARSVLLLSCKLPYFEIGLTLTDGEVTLADTIVEYGLTGVFTDAGSRLHSMANLIVNNDIGLDCNAGEVDSCYDLLAGNGVDISDGCRQPD